MSIFRILLKAVGILFVSLLLHLVQYGTTVTLESSSNALFVVTLIVFLMSLILQTGAFQVFSGFGYSTRALWSQDFRKKYPAYADYREERVEKLKDKPVGYLEMLIASGIVLLTAVVLGRLV